MRFFIDTSDLLDVIERARPVTIAHLRSVLQKHNATVVLNVIAVSEAIPHGRNTRQWRTTIQALESLPHEYLRLRDLRTHEFTEAVDAFSRGREYSAITSKLFVDRWYHTFWHDAAPDQLLARVQLDMMVGLTLADQVAQVLPVIRAGSSKAQRAKLQRALDEERMKFGKRRTADSFEYGLYHALSGTSAPWPGDFKAFAEWLRADGCRAPGWRICHETREELRGNVRYKVRPGDLGDLSHVQLLPYVDAATFDRAFGAHVGQAISRLRRTHGRPELGLRFQGVRELLRGPLGG